MAVNVIWFVFIENIGCCQLINKLQIGHAGLFLFLVWIDQNGDFCWFHCPVIGTNAFGTIAWIYWSKVNWIFCPVDSISFVGCINTSTVISTICIEVSTSTEPSRRIWKIPVLQSGHLWCACNFKNENHLRKSAAQFPSFQVSWSLSKVVNRSPLIREKLSEDNSPCLFIPILALNSSSYISCPPLVNQMVNSHGTSWQ